MTAKYITASLLTVSRMLGTPGCTDFMSGVCTITSTKTTISKGRDEWFNSKGIEEKDEMLAKSKSEGYLSDYPESSGASKT